MHLTRFQIFRSNFGQLKPLQKFVLPTSRPGSEDRVLPLLIAGMWAGLLWSRALLSISMAAFILFAAYLLIREWSVGTRMPDLFRPSLMLLFIVPLVSGFWSDDRSEWLKAMQVKLPLLLLPIVCPALALMSPIAQKKLFYLLGLMLLISMSKSLVIYLSNPATYGDAYLKARVLPVDMSGDHLRLSWLLSAVYAWVLYVLLHRNTSLRPADRRALIILAASIILFLHLLAAKTGILGIYLVSLLAILMHFRLRAMKWMLLSMVVIPLLAWMLLPTFRNRMKFVRWDFQHYSQGKYREGLSDAQRVISWRAGMDIWKQAPLTGIGFGDIRAATLQWHATHRTGMKDHEQILPSNQFLVYAAGAGLMGLAVMMLASLVPFLLAPYQKYFAWLSFHLLSLMGFLYENALEGQYGVFIYAFLGSWLWVELSIQGSASEKGLRAY
jgi:O-antigen ligase